MPPVPTTSKRPAKGRRPKPSTSADREPTSGESSSARPSSSRSRTPNRQVLQEQVARSYMMVGTMLMPFGRFYPVAGQIGENMRHMSNEAAEAWLDLATKDKRVLELLENAMSASAYGNLLGIHLAMFASAIPGVGAMANMSTGASQQDIIASMWNEGRAAGMSDEEIQQAIANQFGNGQTVPMPAQSHEAGGPGDTIRTGGQPVPAAPPVQSQQSGSKAAIVSPQELGVTVAGPDGTFPADASPPNGSGEVSGI